MDAMQNFRLQLNQRVRIVQTVDTREGPWQTAVEGVVKAIRAKPTGSWFAHGKNDKLWLTRVLLQKDDGELVELVIDSDTSISLSEAAGKAPSAAPATH